MLHCSLLLELMNMQRSRQFKKISHGFVKRILFFGINSGIHGVKHVFGDRRHMFTRMFWLSILLVSTGCLYPLLMPVLLRVNDVAFTPDTLYLDWETTFPAVTVCESYNSKMAQRKFAQLFPNFTASLNYDYRRYLMDLLYGHGTCSRSVCVPCGDNIPCDLPWSDIVRDVHLKCTELLLSCRFNSENFSCCNEFLPVDSEYGPCYAFNSLQRKLHSHDTLVGMLAFSDNLLVSITMIRFHTELDVIAIQALFRKLSVLWIISLLFESSRQDTKYVNIALHALNVSNAVLKHLGRNTTKDTLFMVNRTSGPGTLSFELISNAQISIHSTEELSTNILDTKFKIDVNTNEHRHMDILFTVLEVDNEPLVRHEDINVRKCRYTDEIPPLSLHTYPVYSYGACRLAMDTKKSLKYCGCIHPVRDNSYSGNYCNYTGLNCLVTYKAQRIKLGVDAKSDSDDCLPSCEETELTIVHVSRRGPNQSINGRDRTLMNIKMTTLPSIRYRKDLLRTNLDLVVSVGGMLGLFFSASILSVAEVFYLILRDPVNEVIIIGR